MTVTALDVRNEYTGVATQTIFNYTFLIFTNQDLNVYITPSGQDADDAADLTTAYTVDSGTLGNPSGGFITLNSGVSAGDLVTIVSSIVEDRTTDYQNSGDFLPDTVNEDFDRVVSIAKQVDDRSGRTLAFPESLQNATSLTLPLPVAGSYVIWNPAETGLINAGAPAVILPDEMTGTQVQMVADASLIVGDFVRTTGYSAKGDGGDNIYEVVASGTGTDDGGSYIDLPNTTPVTQAKGLFPQGIHSVKQWGATGDGSTDDTLAITNAMDYVGAGTLYIPEGSYTVPVDSAASFTPPEDITIYGDGQDTIFQFDLIDAATTYKLFNITNPGVTFKDLRIRVRDTFAATTVICFAWDASRLTIDNVEVFGGVTDDGTLGHLFMAVRPIATGSVSDLKVTNSYWHDVTRAWLRANTDTSTVINCRFIGNRFERCEATMFALNSPKGAVNSVIFQGNIFNTAFIDVVQSDGFFIGPQATDVVISGNIFLGVGTECIHIEEKVSGLIITDNDITMDVVRGISILENKVGDGVTEISPSRVIIDSNVIRKAGTVNEAGSRGIEIVNRTSVAQPLIKSSISNNLIVNWDEGISNGGESFATVNISNNNIDTCNTGFVSNFGMPSFKDNYITNCTTGITTRDGGGMFGFVRFHNVTNRAVAVNGDITLLGFGVDFDRNDLAAGNNDFPVFPLVAGNRVFGVITTHSYFSNADESIRCSQFKWDGTTPTETAQMQKDGGQLTTTFFNTGSALQARVNNSGALLADAAFYLNFDGTVTYTV